MSELWLRSSWLLLPWFYGLHLVWDRKFLPATLAPIYNVETLSRYFVLVQSSYWAPRIATNCETYPTPES